MSTYVQDKILFSVIDTHHYRPNNIDVIYCKHLIEITIH
jgi:hypothetical protein